MQTTVQNSSRRMQKLVAQNTYYGWQRANMPTTMEAIMNLQENGVAQNLRSCNEVKAATPPEMSAVKLRLRRAGFAIQR